MMTQNNDNSAKSLDDKPVECHANTYRPPQLHALGGAARVIQGGDDGDRYDLNSGYYSIA